MTKLRHELLIDFIDRNGFVSTSQLCEEFNVSRATMHRDLTALADNGKIELFHGGARSINREEEISLLKEGYKIKDDKPRERQTIAEYCADNLIDNGDIIFIGASRISIRLAELLAKKELSITVVSDAIYVINRLLDNSNIRLINIGGKYNGGISYGELADEQIRKFYFNKAFVGTDSLSLDNGCCSTSLEFCNAKKAVKSSSSLFYVYTISSSFSGSGKYKFCDLNEVSEIITDGGLSDSIYKMYTGYGVKIKRV